MKLTPIILFEGSLGTKRMWRILRSNKASGKRKDQAISKVHGKMDYKDKIKKSGGQWHSMQDLDNAAKARKYGDKIGSKGYRLMSRMNHRRDSNRPGLIDGNRKKVMGEGSLGLKRVIRKNQSKNVSQKDKDQLDISKSAIDSFRA